MNFTRQFFAATTITSLAFFAACGDSDSSSTPSDVVTPDVADITDISDSTDNGTTSKDSTTAKDSTVTKDPTVAKNSSATKDSTAVKDTSSVKSSSSVNDVSSSSSGNNPTSSSSDSSTTSSSSSINGNVTAGSCQIKVDTLSSSYPVTCDGYRFGSLHNKLGEERIEFKNEGKNCSLSDHLDGIVDVTCGDTTYTLYKGLCNSTPYDPTISICSYRNVLSEREVHGDPTLVSCSSADLWCHNPNTEDANTTHDNKVIYKEGDGIYFSNSNTHDLTDWQGICITYTSDKITSISLDLGDTKNKELNNNLPQVVLARASVLPIEECFSWAQFKQRRWETPFIYGNDATKSIASFKIDFQGSSEGSFNLIRFRSLTEANNDPEIKRTCSEDMWCAEIGEYQVHTGCGIDRIGSWEATTDKKDGGSSTVTWPTELGNDYSPTAVDRIIDEFVGLTAAYHLGEGIDKPYVKIGFELDFDSVEDFDISSWNGFCLSYKADHDFAIELASYDKNATNNPKAAIQKSFDRTTIDIPWTSLDPADASSVNRINFVFSGNAGTNGIFAFYTFGKLGTCK